MKVRTRFSPSPTGLIHLGNARAALYSALFALHQQGVFILRIEDTDLTRSLEHYVEKMQEDLTWLGVLWEEGPGKPGEFGPYWQSQRQDIYKKYYEILENKDLVYRCFCTDQELLLARKLQLSRGLAPRYAGTCLKLSNAEIEANLASSKKFAWRFKVEKNKLIEFTDIVKGHQQFNTNDIGDFIIRRADGTAPFLFCNAIDDALMKITHVLRGEDHLSNTPRQILLLNTLSLPIPHYGHLSLIVGHDGTPLSKRHGSFSLQEMREQGYLPLALINYLARLGHSYETNDLLPIKDLAANFSLEKLSCSPVRFDKDQLRHWQKIAVQNHNEIAFWKWVGEDIQNKVPLSMRELFFETIKANIEFPNDVLTWIEIFFQDKLQFSADEKQIVKSAGEQFFVEAELAVDKYDISFSDIVSEMKQTLGLQGKKLFMPFRVALTGLSHGPELLLILKILGKNKVKERLGQAFKLASE